MDKLKGDWKQIVRLARLAFTLFVALVIFATVIGFLLLLRFGPINSMKASPSDLRSSPFYAPPRHPPGPGLGL
jgi:hypothetical protein